MTKKYYVELTAEEKQEIEAFLSHGERSVRAVRRAYILLQSDQKKSDTEIAGALDVSVPTIERTRKRYVEKGLDDVLHPKQSRRIYRRKLEGVEEAHLIALACSEAPEGRERWTLRLLADKMVELEYVDEVSHETVRRVLKKRNQTLAARNVVYPAPCER